MKRSFLLFLMVSSIASAQEQAPPRLLTLAECMEMAYRRNPSIRIADARLRGAEAKARETSNALLPQLKLSSRVAQLSAVDEFTIQIPFGQTQTIFPSITHTYSARLSLQQPIFTGFRLAKSAEMAEYQKHVAREEKSRDESELRLNVALTYWGVYRAIKVEQAIAQTVAQLAERVREVRNFAEQGLLTEGDVLKVEAQLSDVHLKHLEARSNIRLTSMALNSIIGLSLETDLLPSDQPDPPEESLGRSENLSSLIQKAKQARPELKAMEHRKAMGMAGVTAARGAWFPQIALSANYDYARPNQRVIPPKDRWNGTWDVGLSMQWNVWDWFTTYAQANQAEAALEQTQASISQLEDVVALDVAQQYYRKEEARMKISVAENGVRQATESHRIASEKFKQGLLSNIEMLDAETALLQARIAHTQAAVDYVVTKERLRKAVGF
jgi:outer membrane protein